MCSVKDRFNMAIRKFLKEVGVTSRREIERLVRDGEVKGPTLRFNTVKRRARKAGREQISSKSRNSTLERVGTPDVEFR
jgi:16S rRNA U516 pseudouridylate synthase RsuA-like enzyme